MLLRSCARWRNRQSTHQTANDGREIRGTLSQPEEAGFWRIDCCLPFCLLFSAICFPQGAATGRLSKAGRSKRYWALSANRRLLCFLVGLACTAGTVVASCQSSLATLSQLSNGVTSPLIEGF